MQILQLSLGQRSLRCLCVVALLKGSLIAVPGAAQCRNCTDAPAPECGWSFGHHYHGGIGAFFGIISDIGYYCHNGASCSADIPCWPEFRSIARLRQVATTSDAGVILARAEELHLQIDVVDNALAILNCDRSAIVHRIRVGRPLVMSLRRHFSERAAFIHLYRVINRAPGVDASLRESATGIVWSGLSGS